MTEFAIGTHAVETAIEAAPGRIKRILVDAGAKVRLEKILRDAQAAQIKIAYVPRDTLDRQFPRGSHQGIIAEMTPFAYADLASLLAQTAERRGKRVALILDSVTDPQNLGAILRSAGAFGADFLVISKDRSAPVTPIVSKISAGALDVVPIAQETNLTRALEVLKEAGFWCYALEAAQNSFLSDHDLKGDIALILGSEGKGIRRLVKDRADAVCALPAGGPIPSLNVASAAACALYEVFRQRIEKKIN